MLVHFRRREGESQEEISISEVSKWKREKHRRRRLEERQRGRERDRERRELSKGEKSRHVLLTSQEQKDTEREGERDRGQTEDPFCGAIGASKIKYLLARSPSSSSQSWRCVVCRFLLSDHTWSWPPTTSRLPNPRLPLSPPVCRLVRPRFQSAVLVFGSRDDRVGREGNSQNLARPSLGPRSFPLPSPAHLVRVNGWRPHNNSVGNVTIHSLGRDDAGRDGEGHTTTIYIATLNGRDQEICCTRRRGGVTLAQMENFCYGQEDVSAFHRHLERLSLCVVPLSIFPKHGICAAIFPLYS